MLNFSHYSEFLWKIWRKHVILWWLKICFFLLLLVCEDVNWWKWIDRDCFVLFKWSIIDSKVFESFEPCIRMSVNTAVNFCNLSWTKDTIGANFISYILIAHCEYFRFNTPHIIVVQSEKSLLVGWIVQVQVVVLLRIAHVWVEYFFSLLLVVVTHFWNYYINLPWIFIPMST